MENGENKLIVDGKKEWFEICAIFWKDAVEEMTRNASYCKFISCIISKRQIDHAPLHVQ